jgi:sugar lactone lactonase YvrE
MNYSRVLLSVVVFASAGPLWAESTSARARLLSRDALAAADGKDLPTFLAKMEEAVALRPDIPRLLVNLAAAQLANEKPDDAIATLERLAALGLNSPVEKSDDFAALRGKKEFDAVVKKIAANMQSQGRGEIAFSLREVTGLIEGIAWREKTREFYFGDVNGRCVWVRNSKDGTLRRLTPEGDELLGVFGLAIDEGSGALWAATSAVAGMRGFTSDQDGTAALSEIDLDSGAIRRVIPLPRKADDRQSHVFGDLTLAPDGGVLVSDSGGPAIWRLAPGATALEPLVESDEFNSLQGIVVAPGGGALYVADYANGLLRVDLGSRAVQRLDLPPNTTLVGVDGIALAPNGDLLAIQNGLRPNRVLRIKFDGGGETVSAVTVLEKGHPSMAEPSLGCIAADGDFYFIGNAGWMRFEGKEGQPTAPRLVPIFKTRVGDAADKKPKKS